MKQIAVLAAAGVLAFALVGCTEESAGTPVPPSNTTSASPTNVFAGMKACDLLAPITDAEGFDPVYPEDYESENGCSADKPRTATVSLYLVDKAGISDVTLNRGGQLVDTQVAGRAAKQRIGDGGDGSCAIAVAVTETSRLSISEVASGQGQEQQACQDVISIAEQVAPQLPRG